MKYTQPTFSVPTGNGRISQTEYEIRVGLRCPKCEALLAAGNCACYTAQCKEFATQSRRTLDLLKEHGLYKGQNALNIDPATGKPPTVTVRLDCHGPLLDMTFGKAIEVETLVPHHISEFRPRRKSKESK